MEREVALAKIKKFTDMVQSRLSKVGTVETCEVYHFHTPDRDRIEIYVYTKEPLTMHELCAYSNKLSRIFMHVPVRVRYEQKQLVFFTELPSEVLAEEPQ